VAIVHIGTQSIKYKVSDNSGYFFMGDVQVPSASTSLSVCQLTIRQLPRIIHNIFFQVGVFEWLYFVDMVSLFFGMAGETWGFGEISEQGGVERKDWFVDTIRDVLMIDSH